MAFVVVKNGAKKFAMLKLKKENEQLKTELEHLKTKLSGLEEERKKLIKKNFYDEKCGFYRRWYFEQRVEDELRRAVRYRQFVSFILLHVSLKGKCLSKLLTKEVYRIGRIMQNGLQRCTDILSFFEKDQIVVVLPETDKDGAMNVVKRYQSIFINGRLKISYALETYPVDFTNIKTVWDRLEKRADGLCQGKQSLPEKS